MVATTKKHPTIGRFDDGRAPKRSSKFVGGLSEVYQSSNQNQLLKMKDRISAISLAYD
jgi:hypothetical protein